MRAASFVRSVENDSAGAAYYEEFVTDSLGCIRVDSLVVDVATIEIVTAGEGVFDKIAAEDVQNGDSVQFVLKKTGSMRGRVYLPATLRWSGNIHPSTYGVKFIIEC